MTIKKLEDKICRMTNNQYLFSVYVNSHFENKIYTIAMKIPSKEESIYFSKSAKTHKKAQKKLLKSLKGYLS